MNVVGWVGMALILAAGMNKNVRRLRQFSALGSLALLAYSISMHAWPLVAVNGLSVVIHAVHIVLMKRKKSK